MVTTALIVFAAIFVAELPDKTALASLILGTRYPARWVFAGVFSAFVATTVLAVAVGSVLRLIPHRPLQVVVAMLFVLGAVLLLREGFGDDESDEDEAEIEAEAPPGLTPRRVALTSFGVIFLAEFGDLTQILTANLAAKYDDPLAVGVGATLGLWAVGSIGILGGRALLDRVPLRAITSVAAAIMLGLAVWSAVEAVRG